jgi:RNA polymerase-binding transcription factor DksA
MPPNCAGCEGYIKPKRLAAIPWAALCIADQEEADREQNTAWEGIETSLFSTAV